MKTGNAPSCENPSGCLVRLYWMLFGNILLLGCAALMMKTGAIAIYGSAYFAVAASIIAARFADIRYFNGQKADASGPATMDDMKKYAATVFAIYLLFFIVLYVAKLKI